MVQTLAREIYSIAESARLLNMSSATLAYWLEGRSAVEPVLRPKPTGSRTLTWGEFVEAGLLRQYRNNQIPMAELRIFISTLRDELGVPYPLAHAQPFMSGRDPPLDGTAACTAAGERGARFRTGWAVPPPPGC